MASAKSEQHVREAQAALTRALAARVRAHREVIAQEDALRALYARHALGAEGAVG